jgi:hypothetical protein
MEKFIRFKKQRPERQALEAEEEGKRSKEQ